MKHILRRLRPLLWALLIGLCLSPGAAAFSDVGPGDWFAGAVGEMTEAGLLSGYPDGSFRPNQTISAAELVAVVARARGLSPAEGQGAHWAAGYLQAALDRGWYDWDEIPPTGEEFDQPIPRQVAVKILMKAFLPDARGDYNTESARIRGGAGGLRRRRGGGGQPGDLPAPERPQPGGGLHPHPADRREVRPAAGPGRGHSPGPGYFTGGPCAVCDGPGWGLPERLAPGTGDPAPQ